MTLWAPVYQKNAVIRILEKFCINVLQLYTALNIACNTNTLLLALQLCSLVGHWEG